MSNNETSLQYQRMRTAIEYLYDNAQSQPKLETLASLVHLSPEHFQKVFSQYTGLSPKQMLSYLNVQTAKTHLLNHQNLMQSAFAAGLSGTGRLHDLFIKIEGMTPFEYQNGGINLIIFYEFYLSPLGDVLLANTEKGVCFMAFVDDEDVSLNELMAQYPNAKYIHQSHLLQTKAMSFFGQNPQGICLRLKGTPFQLKVWQALLHIPSGKLSSYGEIAEYIGHANAYRAVGSAVGKNPVALLIPCHRVIKESGMIGQYRWGRGRKIALLAKELSERV